MNCKIRPPAGTFIHMNHLNLQTDA